MRESRVTEYVTQIRRNVERRKRTLEEDNAKGIVTHVCVCVVPVSPACLACMVESHLCSLALLDLTGPASWLSCLVCIISCW